MKVLYRAKLIDVDKIENQSSYYKTRVGGEKIKKQDCILTKYEDNEIVIMDNEIIVVYESIVKYGKIYIIYYHSDSIYSIDKFTGEIEYKTNSKKFEIEQDDYSLTKLTRKEDILLVKKSIKSCLEYNSSVMTINKNDFCNSSDNQIQKLDIGYVYFKWFLEMKLNRRHLCDIIEQIKATHDIELSAEKMVIHPFSFIRETFQIINFDQAFYIDKIYSIGTSVNEIAPKWVYSFVNKIKLFYIPKETLDKEFEDGFLKTIKITDERQRVILRQSVFQNTDLMETIFVDNKEYYTTKYLKEFEEILTQKLIDLFYKEPSAQLYPEDEINEYISEFERESNPSVLYTEEQRDAIIKIFKNRLTIINGYPGTGKTTIIDCVIYVLHRFNPMPTISMLAPTGLAFKNIWSKIDKYELNPCLSGTVHRAIYTSFREKGKCSDSTSSDSSSDTSYESDLSLRMRINNYLEHHLSPQIILNKSRLIVFKEQFRRFIVNDYKLHKEFNECYKLNLPIFIDETSMLDIYMFKLIIDVCEKLDCKLILIGDHNQLPSIGPGTVLYNLLNCNLFNDNIVKLTQIKRQNGGKLLDTIKCMATNPFTNIGINGFDNETLIHKDISFIQAFGGTIREEGIRELINNYGMDSSNSKFICYNSDPKRQISSPSLNKRLQKYLNLNHDDVYKKIPRHNNNFDDAIYCVGDPVLLKCNFPYPETKQVFVNGESAIIENYEYGKVYVKFANVPTPIEITEEDLYEYFQQAYALTVHKSQGGQYDIVVIIIDNEYFWNKNTLFTAMSRAKNKCILVCNINDFKKIQKKKGDQKVSLLLNVEVEEIEV